MSTFFDTNALIYLLDTKSEYHQSSMEALKKCKSLGPVIVCDMVYCEFSIGMKNKSEVDAAISSFAFERYNGDDEALVKAGIAFKKYKEFLRELKEKEGAVIEEEDRNRLLPDFIIGAIADNEGSPLVTKDTKYFKKWFASLPLIVLSKC
ncbi:type II toxin-antitoxin system VapC family toxin [Azospirillum sp. TSA6c]|uniref:type II toxin-antitoxin system VapC family toxin n=1 Tax=unclassified Azospirillum TaxID=2630922 RepID=UPI000D656CF5|nr:type II toxin-antitoxin system VapC family toxin [Azospirillum sp. TSA6c]